MTEQPEKHVRVLAEVDTLRRMGHPRDFDDEEIELLREWARRLKEERKITTTELGELMGVKQQNASRFIADRATGGISRISGNRLASAAGFRDAEELIAEGRAMAGLRSLRKGNVWHARDSAVRVAEAMGYGDGAIAAVVARESSGDAGKRPVKWWLTQIALEELRRA
jgi:hypothetical protein